jgi:hypothetical protein
LTPSMKPLHLDLGPVLESIPGATKRRVVLAIVLHRRWAASSGSSLIIHRCKLAVMGRRKPLHDELVQAIRELVADANLAAATRWSDDMDQYYVEKTGESPMNREVARFAASEQEARALADELLELGPEAAEAVAKGLRMRGRFRNLLIPFAEKYRTVVVIRDALELVAKRQSDGLAAYARKLLAEEKRSP